MKKILIFTLLLCGVSSFAIDWRVGVGGSYSLYAAKGEKDAKDIGDYLTLAARESTEKLL